MLPFRAWELLIGGLLAIGVPRAPGSARARHLASWAGMAMIAAAITLYDPATPFPGLAALPPTLGAALLIWSGGATAATPIHRVLASPPIVAVGKASYSFYLWHFPVFVFAIYLTNAPIGPWLGLGLAAVALALAFVSLRLVEDPIRHARGQRVVPVLLALMAVAGVTGLALARSGGVPSRFDAAARRIADASNDRDRHAVRCMSNGDRIVAPGSACLLGKAGTTPDTLLWGDSHALVASTALGDAATQAGRAIVFEASADCPPGLDLTIDATHAPALQAQAAYRFCGAYNRRMLDRALRDPAFTRVVIAARWTGWRIGEPGNAVETPVDLRLVHQGRTAATVGDNAAIYEASLDALARALAQAGKRVFLVGPVPEPSVDVPQSLFVARFGVAEVTRDLPLRDVARRHARATAILTRVAARNVATLLMPTPYLCVHGRCPLMIDGNPVLSDHNHLSVDAARRTAPLYAPVFAP